MIVTKILPTHMMCMTIWSHTNVGPARAPSYAEDHIMLGPCEETVGMTKYPALNYQLNKRPPNTGLQPMSAVWISKPCAVQLQAGNVDFCGKLTAESLLQLKKTAAEVLFGVRVA